MRPRSSYGSSHRSGFSHRSSPGSSHGSSDLPRPRAEPLLAVDYAKQRAQRAEKELLELRPRAAGLLAALEQAKRDMADAASVATLRHEEAARQREEERAREQRGEEAHPARSSGPFPSP